MLGAWAQEVLVKGRKAWVLRLFPGSADQMGCQAGGERGERGLSALTWAVLPCSRDPFPFIQHHMPQTPNPAERSSLQAG